MRSDMELWTEVRRRVLTGELSKRAACRQYTLGWHTLRKILAHDEPPGYRQSQPRAKPKIDAFLSVIHQILVDDRQAPKKQRHTAWRIFQRLREEHQFPGRYTIVKDEARPARLPGPRARPRLPHQPPQPPTQQARIDPQLFAASTTL